MSAPSRASATVRAAAAGVSAHLNWQLASRLCSFALRAVVVRTLGPALVASTELNVALVVSLLILPVSGFRKVSLRAPSDASVAALSAVCVIVTAGAALLVTALLALRDPRNMPALAIVAASLVVRALAEPHVIFTSRRERYTHNSRARALSVLVSGLTSAVAVRLARAPAHAAPAAALGHLAYSVSMLFSMRVARGTPPIPFPAPRAMPAALRADDLHIAAAGTGQYLLKYVLGNGEAFVLGALCAPSVQGAYFLAGNFASIVARFFNESLEDQCFNVFARLAPAFSARPKARGDGAGRRGLSEEEVKDARATCVRTMHLALKAALLVAVLFALIGPAYAYSAVRVLYDVEWSERSPAARLLSHYFLYLVFMSANGVTEAFFLSAAARDDIRRHTVFSGCLSVGYMVLLFFAARAYEATGIIAVNCLNMALRTTYSTAFYCRLTGQRLSQLFEGAVPHPLVFAALAFARGVSLRSETRFVGRRAGLLVMDVMFRGRADVLRRVAMHAVSGVFALLVFAGALFNFERPFLRDMRKLMRRQAPQENVLKKEQSEANGAAPAAVAHAHAD